jgi:HEPN domain-containing protein
MHASSTLHTITQLGIGMCCLLFNSKKFYIDLSVKSCLALAILADYSFFHSLQELAKMLSDLESSSQWSAIKEAVNQLHLEKKTLRSEIGRDSLEKKILQIALDNRLVRATVLP